jgi:hypothetical protein
MAEPFADRMLTMILKRHEDQLLVAVKDLHKQLGYSIQLLEQGGSLTNPLNWAYRVAEIAALDARVEELRDAKAYYEADKISAEAK